MTIAANDRTVTRTRFSFVWNYEKDEQWLTALSAQGLHLVKPGIARHRFERDPAKRYVYRMDYHPIKERDQLDSYLALFEDAGWEHAGSKIGWHYFRRPYVEGASPEIYTDRTSIRQLLQRIQFTLLILALINVPLLIINTMNLFKWGDRSQVVSGTIGFVVVLELLVILLLFYGCVRFQHKIKKL